MSTAYLAERAKSLEATDGELKEMVGAAEKRLLDIDASKKRLSGLQPMLERLACIADRLEILQPKRVVYEEKARSMAAVEAAMFGGEKSALLKAREVFWIWARMPQCWRNSGPERTSTQNCRGRLLALEGF